jgi:PAS domain S-box-containing protein
MTVNERGARLRRAAHRPSRISPADPRDESYRAIFHAAAVGIVVSDRERRILEVNSCLCELLGYSAEELCGTTGEELTYSEDRAATRAGTAALLAGEVGKFTLEKRYVRKDGAILWCRATVTAVREPDGQVRHLVGVIEAIEARKAAEEARNRLAAVVESSDDAIISKTLEGVITSWNQAAERIFGYTAAEAIGKPVTILIPPDHLDEEPSILERLARGERIDHYQTVRMRKDGTRLDVSLTVSPIRDGQGTIIGASKISRDISRQKLIEREVAGHAGELERLNTALRENDRRKDEFLAVLAHELRNPLAPIRQAALISKAPGASEAQKRWSHDVIARQVQHMSLLLDDLLDVSRITRGTLELRPESIKLAAVVEAAIETARPLIDAKGHELSVVLPAEPLRFIADPLRLAQVLSNLLTNAAKYSDPHGRIRVSAQRADGALTISVADSGIGIPADALEEVFAMFSQVKTAQDRSDGGLGIGLALAKGLVELHGGRLTVHSAGPGRGSEFIVHLPLRQQASPRNATTAPAAAARPVGKRVLIADDNRDAAASLAICLEIDGHEVSVVHDGDAALAAFSAWRPEAVLLDIGMPGLDGYEVARRMRAASTPGELTLIAITGWGQASDKADALRAGFDHHFTKPVEPEQLSALLCTIPAAPAASPAARER